MELKIEGKDIHPGTVKASDLADTIKSFENMLLSEIVACNPEIIKKDIVIGVNKIIDGSIRLCFFSKIALASIAYKYIVKCIDNSQTDLLSQKTQEAIEKISSVSKKYNGQALLMDNNKETKIESLSKQKNVTSQTSICGEIKRVGGVIPKVSIQEFGEKGQIINADVTKKLALEISPYLYRRGIFYGKSEWSLKSMQIKKFEIKRFRILDLKKQHKSLKSLSNQLAPYLNKIDDVNEWCNKLRQGDI